LTETKMPRLFRNRVGLVVASLVAAATGSSLAQSPVPSTSQTPPAVDDAAGRGGRRGAPAGVRNGADLQPHGPILPLTAAEEAKRFWLPPGYKMEAVLSEPEIQEPTQIAFDGN